MWLFCDCIKTYADSLYACVFICDDGSVLALRMCCVHTSPLSHCEVINLKISVLNNQLSWGLQTMGKTAGRQPVGLVESANKTLLKEVSGYCIMVSSTQTQKAQTRFTGLLRQMCLDLLNTVYLTCKHISQLTIEGRVMWVKWQEQ